MLEKLKSNFRSYFSKGPRAAIVVIVFFLCICITIINAKKTVVVIIEGKSTKITTLKSDVSGALNDGNIKIAQKDKVLPDSKAKIKNGDKIYVKRAVNIAVQIDGKEMRIKSAEDNIEDMLKAEKITLRDEDEVLPARDTKLMDELQIAITRIDAKEEMKSENLSYKTVIQYDSNLEKGVSKTLQEGSDGNKEISYKVVYKNGVEVSRELVSEAITQNPTDKIVAIGTLGVVNTNRGEKLFYTKDLKVKATAYSSSYGSTGKNPGDRGYGITATGTKARRKSDGYSSVAVDPKVIPLGTKLYITGYGCAIAEDVGSGIKGNSIDLYFDTDAQAYNWGVRSVQVYILKK